MRRDMLHPAKRGGHANRESTMQYILMNYLDEASMANATPEQAMAMSAHYAAYTEALMKAGAMVSGERLKPTSTATTVRVRNERTEVLDGPFAESKEQLGGFYIIEASDLDAAIAWAARCPGASHGTMEVRPIWTRA
jgi:hypothetical protein